ncbi:uncharacterized protein BO66DRAFT_73574 [Aspergillus aculeatinus CBS 121060]|uniref:Uncharacterized protein n=1 Tax=Aspergillus aculeatinus CBS 121060 TaxID=1448322 RepID=A0ACD1HBR1_9EURO|nr:hypothetical protein BO66DRAFT_73574 [Aspergillus aculeatinus CBS 121060]RAH70858.1 hypothetical protein BO66DRAFT_73574 [Aspergillus aculeatinus CBS 121060]
MLPTSVLSRCYLCTSWAVSSKYPPVKFRVCLESCISDPSRPAICLLPFVLPSSVKTQWIRGSALVFFLFFCFFFPCYELTYPSELARSWLETRIQPTFLWSPLHWSIAEETAGIEPTER